MSFLQNIFKRMNRNTILIAIAVVGILITGALIYAKDANFALPNILGMSDKQVAQKAIDYINDNQLSQTPASLVSFSQESGLVKVKIKIGENSFDSYVTKDGKLLLPEAISMVKKEDSSANGANTTKTPEQAAAEITKTDSPLLQAFVVSRCPYGLQMQRMIDDAVKSIPDLAKYIKVEYMGAVSSDGKATTAMHGDAEATENLRQICLRDEQPAKYWGYVACQMKKGDTAGCQASSGIDVVKMNACVADSNRGVAFAKKDFANNEKYGVTGSPTLIMNGVTVSEFDFGGRTSEAIKSLVCAGFNTKPSFCSTALNTADAATSFSETYSSGNAGATADDSANCAPAQ